MGRSSEPIVLDLASLPREQLGPFLLLGLDKSADKDQIESHWADRLKWSRKGLIKVALEDINWAKDVLNERDPRLRADAASFNTDLIDSALSQLANRYGVVGNQIARTWQPLDAEKDLANYTPTADVPDKEEIRSALIIPEVPEAFPTVSVLLDSLSQKPLDPWDYELPQVEPLASQTTQDMNP
jgi:hypothetical protein